MVDARGLLEVQPVARAAHELELAARRQRRWIGGNVGHRDSAGVLTEGARRARDLILALVMAASVARCGSHRSSLTLTASSGSAGRNVRAVSSGDVARYRLSPP